MATVAPPALVQLSKDLKARPDCPKSYLMDGIVGNTAHLAKARTSGTYHISAEDCGNQFGHLYSLTYTDDIVGGKAHETYASAWDLGWGPADMILVTKRLISSCMDPNDHRMDAVAEVAGTTNGRTVHAYYNNTKTDDPQNTGGWDDGHLTHNHLSIKRNKCNDYAALEGILDVICGVPLETELVMDAEVKARFDKIDNRLTALFGEDTNHDGKPDYTATVQRAVELAVAPLKSELDAIKAKLGA